MTTFKSEDTSRPVRVVAPDGKTERFEPCLYRLKGLAVFDNTPQPPYSEDWLNRREAGWLSDHLFSVTHEASGAKVCVWPTLEEARVAVMVLTAATQVDWIQDMASVERQLKADRTAAIVVWTLKEGRMVMLPAGYAQREGKA